MPEVQLRALDVGTRSTLYVSGEGALYRQYHDTKHWDGPLPPHIDSEGVTRLSGNRRLDTAVEDLFTFRGASGTQHRSSPPAYLRRALSCLLRDPKDIQEFARWCGGIQVTTAWNYAARCVEEWSYASTSACKLVYPLLIPSLLQIDSVDGPLKEVMERLLTQDTLLRGDPEWRSLDNRYAHLRLARLCL